MHNLTKSYNRRYYRKQAVNYGRYYRKLFKIYLTKQYKLAKIALVTLLLKLAYMIDNDTTTKVVGRPYK